MAKQATRLQPGQKFNRWTILEFLRSDRYKSGGLKHIYKMQCECGTVREVSACTVKNGTSRSCGCLQKETVIQTFTKHGQAGVGKMSRSYKAWQSMMSRASTRKTKDENYIEHYRNRGITVCPQWYDFRQFYKDMGDPPDGYSLDRIDVNGNYSPENCRWASWSEQCRNKRSNTWIEFDGESKCLEDWAAFLGMPSNTLHYRIQKMGVTSAFDLSTYRPRKKRARNLEPETFQQKTP